MTDKEILRKVAEQAKSTRVTMKISQKDLEKKSGVPLSAVRRFEQTGEIQFSRLLKIARVLGVLDRILTLFEEEEITDLAALKSKTKTRKRVR